MKGKIFNAQEVQSMIAGNMTMFREVIKGAELEISHPAIHSWAQSPSDQKFYAKAKNDEVKQQYVTTFPFHGIKCPYQVGQKIFCKESFAEIELSCSKGYYTGRRTIYRDEEHEVKWKPAQHMKQEHSRLFPLIKKIRVEKLSEISESDCCEEGFGASFLRDCKRPRFIESWNATHKKPEEKFEANPWVWVVNFEVVK